MLNEAFVLWWLYRPISYSLSIIMCQAWWKETAKKLHPGKTFTVSWSFWKGPYWRGKGVVSSLQGVYEISLERGTWRITEEHCWRTADLQKNKRPSGVYPVLWSVPWAFSFQVVLSADKSIFEHTFQYFIILNSLKLWAFSLWVAARCLLWK